jgi:segregation and condensation protein B
MATVKAIVEALLFASQKPLPAKEIVSILRLASEDFDPPQEAPKAKEIEVVEILNQLAREYEELGRSFRVVEQVGGWQLVTRPEYQLWVRQLFPDLRPTRLSAPALETLAIIAYRQPITKADIEAIRGVAIDGVLQKLLDGALVRVAGRAEIPGRPLLYETTQHFMEHFGLRTLDELPNASELRNLPLPKGEATSPADSASSTAPDESRQTAEEPLQRELPSIADRPASDAALANSPADHAP